MIKKILYIFLIVYFGSLVFISLLCPILEFQRSPLAPQSYGFLKNFCHQIPSRCLWILESNIGLCSRCFFLYLSFFIGSILLLIIKKQNLMSLKKTFLVFLLMVSPLIIDGTTQFVTNYLSNNFLRSISGLLGGFGFALLSINLFRGGK